MGFLSPTPLLFGVVALCLTSIATATALIARAYHAQVYPPPLEGRPQPHEASVLPIRLRVSAWELAKALIVGIVWSSSLVVIVVGVAASGVLGLISMHIMSPLVGHSLLFGVVGMAVIVGMVIGTRYGWRRVLHPALKKRARAFISANQV
jgi:hypothetical protein